jgi:hypothetical protein
VGAGVAVAQQRRERGEFPDVAQDRVSVPGSDVLPAGRDECVALVAGKPEPWRLEGGSVVEGEPQPPWI